MEYLLNLQVTLSHCLDVKNGKRKFILTCKLEKKQYKKHNVCVYMEAFYQTVSIYMQVYTGRKYLYGWEFFYKEAIQH